MRTETTRAALRLASAVLCALFCVATVAQAQEPERYDPYAAEKNIEVGKFYLKKKNYDAAIERFKQAIADRPGYALPHRLLGEAYEKKREYASAAEQYEKFLAIVPNSPEAADVRKRLDSVRKKIPKR